MSHHAHGFQILNHFLKNLYVLFLNSNFLTLTMPNFLNGIIRLQFLALSITIVGISRRELEVGQPTV